MVVGIDTDRSAAYDLLLTSNSNQGLSRTNSEINGDFIRQSQYFTSPAEWVALGIRYWRWGSKTRV